MSMEDYKASEEIEGEIEHTRSEMRETLDAIQRKFTPGQMVDQVVTYFRQGPGTFASNLGRVVRDHPIPIALVGTGLAWLAMSRPRRSPAEEEQEAEDEDRYYYASAGGGDYVAAAGAEYAAYTSTAGPRYSAYHASGGESGAEPPSSGGSSSYESYERYDPYEPDEEQRHGRFGRMAGGTRERMSRIGGMAREQGERARTGFTEMVDEQPLLMAAAAFVLGAALGALLPATRREDRLMGEARDDLAHRATEMGREGLGRAERAAGETWTAVSDEMLSRESSSGGEAGTSAAERKAEHMTEQMSEPQRTTTAAASTTKRAAGPASSGGSSRSSVGGSSTAKPGGAAGSTPGESDKNKG